MVQKIALNLVMLGFVVFGIAAIVEWYKKTVRKDQAKVLEIRIVAVLLSCLGAVGMYIAGLCLPNLTLIFKDATTWLDAIVYAVLIFVLQLPTDMKLLKGIMAIAGPLAQSADFRALVSGFIANTGVTVDQLVAALKLFGVTPDKAKKALLNMNVDETAATKITEELQKAIEQTNA